MDKHLHIVCLDVPYPPDYGGVFDLFYKMEALYKEGVKIHLHCFEYGRGRQFVLNNYCVEVNYYKRRNNFKDLFNGIPHIVGSRADKNLLLNLLKDDHPVLLEGIHCTYYLFKNKLAHKKVLVRLHNVEFEYYKNLGKAERSFFKRIYFFIESRLLKKYEKKIISKSLCIGVNKKDIEEYRHEFGSGNIKFLPVFLPYSTINSIPGMGEFCLYHGNLSVIENEKAVEWLLKNVHRTNIPFIIAGKDPSKKLIELVKQYEGVSIVANPSDDALAELIRFAHINILPSFNPTGIKIKLLNALFNGRHCLVNKEAVEGTELEALCQIASFREFKNKVSMLVTKPFTEDDIDLRESVLKDKFNNHKNAELLMQWIY